MNGIIYFVSGSLLTVGAYYLNQAVMDWKKRIYDEAYQTGYLMGMSKGEEKLPTTLKDMAKTLEQVPKTPKEIIIEHQMTANGLVARGRNF